MKIQFQESQLSRPQRESLLSVLDVLQSENQNEIEVTPVEFPITLKVQLDNDVQMMLGWDPGSESYSGISKTEPRPEPKPEPKPDPIPESQKDTADLPKPETEPEPTQQLVMSEIGVRVQALAQALVNLAKPLNTYQRGEIWMQFCEIYVKELMK